MERSADRSRGSGNGALVESVDGASGMVLRKRAVVGDSNGSQTEQAFLLELSDALRNVPEANEIKELSTRALGERLHLSNVGYAELEEDEDMAIIGGEFSDGRLPEFKGRHRVSDFGEGFGPILRAGGEIFSEDIPADPRGPDGGTAAAREFQIRAAAALPLIKQGRLVACLYATHCEPREWREQERQLMREVAERTWEAVERARAEQAVAADLRDTQLLRDLGARLVSETEIQAFYEEVNTAARILAKADASTVQVYDPQAKQLLLLATHGFPPDSTVRFHRVDAASSTSCGVALQTGARTFLDFDDPSLEDPKGDLRWHVEAGYRSAQSTPLIARSGKPIGMLSTHWHVRHRPSERELRFLDLLARQAADLLERKQAEAALRESEEKCRTVLTTMDDGLLIAKVLFDEHDKAIDYLYLEVNPAFYRQCGLPRDIVGKTMREIFPNTPIPWLPIYEKVAKTREPVRFEYDMTIEQLKGYYDVNIVPLGEPEEHRIAVLFKNITDRRRNEIALAQSRDEAERARAEAEAAGRAKDHFLAVLSHELRTPLTPVLMAAELVMEEKNLSAFTRESMEMIRRNVVLESRLVDDLLDVTRIARGKMEIHREPMDLHDAIRHAVEICRPDIEARNHRLGVLLYAASHRLQGDFARLQQVVWNLLKNACKFTPSGGAIVLRTRNEADSIVLEVEDSGIGVEQEALERIFDPFTQASTDIMRRYGGLGLGLAISKASVDAHGGSIQVESEGADRGTSFRVMLPLHPTIS
jgi:signal transduction histidine kinase